MSIDANFVDKVKSCCFQDLCIDSNSGQGSVFEDCGVDLCNDEGDLCPGAWACLGALGEENFLEESVSPSASLLSLGVGGHDDQYDTLMQQLALMVPQAFLKTPIDEFAVVKGALDYVVHLRQVLQKGDAPMKDTDVVRPKTVFIPRSCSEHMRHVQADSSAPDVQLPGEDNSWSLVPRSIFDDQTVTGVSTASLVCPNIMLQSKIPDSFSVHRQTNQSKIFSDKMFGTTPTNEIENTPSKRRKNSYTVLNDHTFSDIVPCSEAIECFPGGTLTRRDMPWVGDYWNPDQGEQFTRIKQCLSSVEKYPVLSSAFSETDWDIPGKNGDDDVFLPSSQPEPHSYTEDKGLRRPKNGFIRFSVEYRKLLAKEHPKLDNREVSKMLGAKWRRMSHEEKVPYEMEFRRDISELRSKHPEWRYAPLKQMESEHIEPMPSRLRPRDKLKKKFLPTIIKYGPDISERRQHRGRKKRGKMAPFRRFNSFAWCQCNLCYKWRYVPCIDDDSLPMYQSMWVCHMNPDPTCNSCFAEDGLSDSHSIMTSSVASSFQSIPCSTVSVFATAANTPIQ
ncbi:uncharacterized protein LOC111134402 [Crassostrea virginica]